MDKSSRKPPSEKDLQPKSKKAEGGIKFTFNKTDLQCFISAKSQSKPREKISPTEKGVQKIQLPPADKMPPAAQKPNQKRVISQSVPIFNNQLLVMHYQQDQMYIDSGRANPTAQVQSHQSQQLQNQVVNSCVKVITQQTDNSSNNPLSARYNQISPQMFMNYDYGWNMNMDLRNRRYQSHDETSLYHVDLNMVEKDGRTTLMLRNIPNKYTRDMILDQIDSLNFKKKYDFFYLPIDYRNQCNVGYAFINFIHTKFISQFYQQFHQKRWLRFNSQKICQVCYARIQGTAQLIHHFKNSNVIQQKDKKLRPLIEVDYSNLAEMVERQKNETSREVSA